MQAATSPQLYDTWVVRDAGGRAATKRPPFLRDTASAQLLAVGRPVPVACCWNGLVVLDAAPLLAGLRMRCNLVSQKVHSCQTAGACVVLDATPLLTGLHMRCTAVRQKVHCRQTAGAYVVRGRQVWCCRITRWLHAVLPMRLLALKSNQSPALEHVKHPHPISCSVVIEPIPVLLRVLVTALIPIA